jgi:hypothetical protein
VMWTSVTRPRSWTSAMTCARSSSALTTSASCRAPLRARVVRSRWISLLHALAAARPHPAQPQLHPRKVGERVMLG